ncbi:MAG: Peroxide operon regulator [Syntrophus sp. PtaB.Bin001]|jgi:Fur family peroxide stress response transcriptional regulator|nr:MAG: Peroxide operon regulator [Syntrophus sp. PtaB.Bin001]
MQNSKGKYFDFDKECRKAGLKVTLQRQEIFEELRLSTDHPSAEALHERLRIKLPNLALDTVYRTLTTFANKGLINRVETAESLGRYEAIHSRHHHLICRRCGEIKDFTWSLLDEASLPDNVGNWGRIDSKNIVIYGLCDKCLNNS